METLGTAAGFIFTLLIFSYLLGDNLLYRLAVYVFIGLAAAYTTIVTIESVLLPLLNADTQQDLILNIVILVVSLILTLLLVLRPIPGLNFLTGIPLAFLVAVGVSVAVLGTISGTLFPLTLDTGTSIAGDVINGGIMLIGVTTSLIYFQYHATQQDDGSIRRSRPIEALATIGRGFIAVTLGALYGTAILTSLTILAGRISFLTGAGG